MPRDQIRPAAHDPIDLVPPRRLNRKTSRRNEVDDLQIRVQLYAQQIAQSQIRFPDAPRVAYFSPEFHQPRDTVWSSRLLLITRGRVSYTIADRTVELRTGMSILVPRGTLREWRVPPAEPLQLEWFLYELQGDAADPPALIRPACDLAFERTAMARLAMVPTTPLEERTREIEAKAALHRFFNHCFPFAASESQLGARSVQAVQAAADYIAANFQRPDPLEHLHDRAGLSLAHFRRVFHATFGVSPARYLLMQRMRHARELLGSSALSVKEIAHATGYADPFYFSRTYRGFWGHPPTQGRGQAAAGL